MNAETLLLRQIHPAFVQGGRVTSQAFRPTPKDRDLLSVYNGDRIEPEAAWRHFTEIQGFHSTGVLAVTCGECMQITLPVRADPDPFPEHAVIDFSGHTKNQAEKKAKLLKRKAEVRDWLYGPAT